MRTILILKLQPGDVIRCAAFEQGYRDLSTPFRKEIIVASNPTWANRVDASRGTACFRVISARLDRSNAQENFVVIAIRLNNNTLIEGTERIRLLIPTRRPVPEYRPREVELVGRVKQVWIWIEQTPSE